MLENRPREQSFANERNCMRIFLQENESARTKSRITRILKKEQIVHGSENNKSLKYNTCFRNCNKTHGFLLALET